MARVRGADTGPEMALRRALWQAGLRYRVRPDIPGRPDLAFMGCRIAVFVDGCFWHGCPVHGRPVMANREWWALTVASIQERDRRVSVQLVEAGWLVVRVWEHSDMGRVAVFVSYLVRARRRRQ